MIENLAKFYDNVANNIKSKERIASTSALNKWRSDFLRRKTKELKSIDDFKHLDKK